MPLSDQEWELKKVELRGVLAQVLERSLPLLFEGGEGPLDQRLLGQIRAGLMSCSSPMLANYFSTAGEEGGPNGNRELSQALIDALMDNIAGAITAVRAELEEVGKQLLLNSYGESADSHLKLVSFVRLAQPVVQALWKGYKSVYDEWVRDPEVGTEALIALAIRRADLPRSVEEQWREILLNLPRQVAISIPSHEEESLLTSRHGVRGVATLPTSGWTSLSGLQKFMVIFFGIILPIVGGVIAYDLCVHYNEKRHPREKVSTADTKAAFRAIHEQVEAAVQSHQSREQRDAAVRSPHGSPATGAAAGANGGRSPEERRSVQRGESDPDLGLEERLERKAGMEGGVRRGGPQKDIGAAVERGLDGAKAGSEGDEKDDTPRTLS